MSQRDTSGFPDLDHLLALARRTRELLDDVVVERVLPDDATSFLEHVTLPHLEGVQAGFVGWLRSEAAELAELQYLIRQTAELRAGAPRSAAEHRAALAEVHAERALADQSGRPPVPPVRRARPWDLAALAHARVVLAVLPRIPDERVRYRAGRRTYRDIPVPRSPAELALRIAELEQQLWRVVMHRPAEPVDPALRRTYGFFDAAEQLGPQAFGRLA